MAQNSIQILIQAKDNASAAIRDVNSQLDQGEVSSGRFERGLSRMRATLLRTVATIGLAGAAAGTASTVLGIKFNSSVEQASAKLNAFMKDGELVAKTLDWVKTEAADTQFSFVDLANAAADLTPVSRTSGQSLKDLVRQAEVLAALNPTEGLTGAVFSLREALSGDWVSIVDRFNLPRQRINQLKAEGVPAMQIISQTLKEMGIDYDLVSKQGQTAAARWDQIKDKFTMAMGAATLPLFEKISTYLDDLNKVDFAQLGENLAAGFQTGLDVIKNISGAVQVLFSGDYKAEWFAGLEEHSWVIDWLKEVHQLWKGVWEFLKPAIDELATAFSTQLLPALQDLWKELGPKLIPALKIIGTVQIGIMVGAVLLLAKVLTAAAHVITGVSNALVWLNETVTGFFTTVLTNVMNAGMAIGAFFADLPTNIGIAIGQITSGLVRFVTTDVPGFVNGIVSWFQQLPSRTGQAVSGLWSAAVGKLQEFTNGIGQWASNTVNSVVNFFRTLPQRIMQAIQGAAGAISSFVSDIGRGFNIGVNLPGRSIGTNFASGGATLVGEHGAEIVNLPRGASVTPAWQSRAQTASDAPGGVTIQIYGNVVNETPQAAEAFWGRVDKTQRLAKMGMAA